jgi:hypothetical protein
LEPPDVGCYSGRELSAEVAMPVGKEPTADGHAYSQQNEEFVSHN